MSMRCEAKVEKRNTELPVLAAGLPLKDPNVDGAPVPSHSSIGPSERKQNHFVLFITLQCKLIFIPFE